jgi:hypothetical protein
VLNLAVHKFLRKSFQQLQKRNVLLLHLEAACSANLKLDPGVYWLARELLPQRINRLFAALSSCAANEEYAVLVLIEPCSAYTTFDANFTPTLERWQTIYASVWDADYEH